MLQVTDSQKIMWGKHEVKNKKFNKSNKPDLPQVRLYVNRFRSHFSRRSQFTFNTFQNTLNNNSFRVHTNAEYVMLGATNDTSQKKMHV